MATTTISNHFKYQLADKQIDLSADTLKAVLLGTSFTFDADSHATYSDVSASELSTGNGYTAGGEALTTLTLAEDDTDNRAEMTCDDVQWDASGGDIGPFGAAIIYDDTTSDDTVILCVDFGTDYTIPNGSSFQLKDIEIRVA